MSGDKASHRYQCPVHDPPSPPNSSVRYKSVDKTPAPRPRNNDTDTERRSLWDQRKIAFQVSGAALSIPSADFIMKETALVFHNDLLKQNKIKSKEW